MKTFNKLLPWLIAFCVIILGGYLLAPSAQSQIEDASNFTGIHIKSSQLGTATPQLMVWNQGASQSIEVRSTAGTSVWSVSAAGGLTQAGGLSNNQNLVVSAPTAIDTATPAVLINNAGVSNQIEVQDGGVVVAQAFNGGGIKLAAPTAVGTAVPALAVNSLGVSRLFEVQDAATPVFSVNNGGTVTGLVLRYGSSGEQLVTGTTLVTGTATASHGLTTVTFCLASMGEDPTAGAGDGAMVTTAVSANTCTLKVWQDDFVSAATETNVDVHWLVVGTP